MNLRRVSLRIGNTPLKNVSPRFGGSLWCCDAGRLCIHDTIANNIAVGEDYIDKQKLRKAVDIANIKEFIEGLPLSYNTKIGNEGIGVSGGQKQRLFIAHYSLQISEYIF